MPTLALLDGHSLAYRAFYALPADLATTAGQVTNAVFGFTSMLIKLLGDEHPDALAVAWDRRAPTFRIERYPEYKAQRESPPDLFASQLPLIREVLESLQVPQIGLDGFEADDVIASIATRAEEADWDVLVVTGDRDAFQLIDDHVAVMYTRRGISDTVRADAAWVMERYGVRPDQYRDYAALRGDTSDNLPGVPGVGEKTASRLIAGYDDLEGVYAHLDEQTPRLRENLADHRDQVFLNRDLMTLVRDVPVTVDGSPLEGPSDLQIQEWDRDEVRRVFDGLAFRTLWDRLLEVGGQAPVEMEQLEVEVHTGREPGSLPAGTEPLAVVGVVDAGETIGIVAAQDDRDGTFIPAESLDAVTPVLAERGIVAHDAKPLVRWFLDLGLEPPPVVFDTALAAYLINPAQRAPDLEELAHRELGLSIAPAPDDGDAAQGSFDFEGSGPDLEGATRRAIATRRLVEPLRTQLEARGGTALMNEIELPLLMILAQMEETGIAVDRAFLVDLGNDLRDRLATLEAEIGEAAGGSFNVNSTLQLREVLYERLGLPVIKKTPKGVPSTDATVLEKLRGEHPVVEALLAYRELEKLRSTYVDALLPLIDDDGRVRGRFNQMAAATGRLSQEQPNLQNIPVRSEEGRIIRRAFVAEPGSRLLVADYSQIELRILAHLSGDPGLVEAFMADLDIHTATAARVAGVSALEVTPDQRRRAKMINFGLLYGMEAYGLAQRLGISRDEAQQHVDAYFGQFPDVQAYMRGIVDEARSTGFTTTLLGRRRYLPELVSSNYRDRQAAERMALNAPIQGSAADIIKKAMVELDAGLRNEGLAAEMVLQIHDELVLEVPDDEFSAVQPLVVSVMESIVDLSVPLRVTTSWGVNLAECK